MEITVEELLEVINELEEYYKFQLEIRDKRLHPHDEE